MTVRYKEIEKVPGIIDGRRIQEILDILDEVYPNATTELIYHNPFELLVAVILSAQNTDKKVNQVTEKLFKKYKTPNDYLEVIEDELDADLAGINYHRSKARYLQGMARMILEKFNGRIPTSMDEMCELPGVGRKTADVVLGTAFGENYGIAVDTHVFRVSKRLGLSFQNSSEKVEKDLMKGIPQNKWTLFSHQIILHGRRICIARKPKCPECPLGGICMSYPHYTGKANRYFNMESPYFDE